MHPALAQLLDPTHLRRHHGFETLRDQLGELPEAALPDLLALALDPQHAALHGPAVAALGDLAWPGAYDAFLTWVTGDDPWLALDAGCALDLAGGGSFGFWERVAPGDVPAPQRILLAGPELRRWWLDEGHLLAPDLPTWRAARGRPPTPEERVFAYVRDTYSAVLSNGWVVRDDRPLPRHAGVHVVGGTCRVGSQLVRVAIELDSDREPAVRRVMAESENGWLQITARATEVEADHDLGPTSLADFADARMEIGPTGSVRERQPPAETPHEP